MVDQGRAVRLRDWLCGVLTPMAGRDPKRVALTEQVRVELEKRAALPDDRVAAARAVDEAVRARVRASGRCNVSRAVSELVRAGLIRRHYQGWRVDHHTGRTAGSRVRVDAGSVARAREGLNQARSYP